MNILGLNAFHADSSACIVKDGNLVCAVEEERLTRLKHWAGFPVQSIEWCLRDAGLKLSDIHIIAINQRNTAALLQKMLYIARSVPSTKVLLSRIQHRNKRSGILQSLRTYFPNERITAKLVKVEHHLAHLSSAFHVSPFADAAVASIDGFGDFSSTAWGEGLGSHLKAIDRIYYPHSLGVFYQALTQYLGFQNYGDEYKVMGLAPYGSPTFLPEMRKILVSGPDGRFALDLQYFKHHRIELPYQWDEGSPNFPNLYSDAMEYLLGPSRRSDEELVRRHIDIANSVQARYEEVYFELLHAARLKTHSENLVLAGGCAMNSVANGKVRRNTDFKRVYVQSAAGDAGGAIGAAFSAWHDAGNKRSFVMSHAYWGPGYSDEQIGLVLESRKQELEDQRCIVRRFTNEPELIDLTATNLVNGMVVGWFQGRMEWGPRALGNRSILGDPRRADMKDLLNQKIKRRESFRPFAPSVLSEHVGEWFEEDDDVPFMMQVFQVREEKRGLIPAVTHVDGSGRLQSVSSQTNPIYHRLISSFYTKTNVPMVLNTSFNENEPVVCTPDEAISCFARTNMDVIVLGRYHVSRSAE